MIHWAVTILTGVVICTLGYAISDMSDQLAGARSEVSFLMERHRETVRAAAKSAQAAPVTAPVPTPESKGKKR